MNDLSKLFKQLLKLNNALPENYNETSLICWKDILVVLNEIEKSYELVGKQKDIQVSTTDKIYSDLTNLLPDYGFRFDFNKKCWIKDLLVCEFCRNVHVVEIYEDGQYNIFDHRGNDVKILQISDLPKTIETEDDLKAVIDFYSYII